MTWEAIEDLSKQYKVNIKYGGTYRVWVTFKE